MIVGTSTKVNYFAPIMEHCQMIFSSFKWGLTLPIVPWYYIYSNAFIDCTSIVAIKSAHSWLAVCLTEVLSWCHIFFVKVALMDCYLNIWSNMCMCWHYDSWQWFYINLRYTHRQFNVISRLTGLQRFTSKGHRG